MDLAWKLSPIVGGLLDAFMQKALPSNGGRIDFCFDQEYSFWWTGERARTGLRGGDTTLFRGDLTKAL